MPSESHTSSAETSASRTFQLTPLTSIRFFAALHIFIFHIYEVHRVSKEREDGFVLPVFDALPTWVLNWIRHGYFSTSLFFLISGFILSYLYVLPDGRMSLGRRTFWVARFARVYPLHILILVIMTLLASSIAATMEGANSFDLVASGLLCATLLQAWFPTYALSWNIPTWALSVVAFYYLTFPWLITVLRGTQRRQQQIIMTLLPVISLTPSLIYLVVFPDGGEPLSFWHEFVMRFPLLWLPHFVMGILLARLFSINRFDLTWQDSRPRNVSWGDVAFAVWIILATTELAIPMFVLRHGLLAPLYLVLIYDLAHGRGLLARVLTLPGLRRLGDASFSIFVLQMPIGAIVLSTASAAGLTSTVSVPLVVSVVVIVSLLSTSYFEKPISNWLRARTAA